MSVRLVPYPEYRDSGVLWLGKVPKHWEVVRSKYLLREVDVRSSTGEEEHLSMSQKMGLVPSSQIEERRLVSESHIGAKLCETGDIVLNRLKAHLGVFALARQAGVVSPDYTVFRPQPKTNPRYLEATLRTPMCRVEFRKRAKGIVEGFWRLYTDDFYEIELPLPGSDEQERIVAFISDFDRRINDLIRAKRRLIELLNEQKQAIIHRAVTRGLDPNVRLKASGVEWIGDVPEHWRTTRLKHSSRILRGKFTHRPRNDPELYDGPYPFIQTGAVAQATKFINSFKQTLNEKGLAVSKMFPQGTLVMTIAANIGDVAILDLDACFPDSVVGFVPRVEMDRDYLYFVLSDMKSELLREAPINTQGNLNVDRIGAMSIPLPPLEEQLEIVRSIEQQTIGLDVAVGRCRREIDLVREYRTRLIADVVTGQLDVRGVELPELPESEPLDDIIGDESEPLDDTEEPFDQESTE